MEKLLNQSKRNKNAYFIDRLLEMEEPNSQKNQFLQKTKRCFCILKLGLISYPIPEIHGKVQHIMKNKRPHHQSDSKSLLLTEAKTKRTTGNIKKYSKTSYGNTNCICT